MPDRKQDVLDMLRELAELTMLDEGDPQSFRVRAYESAAHGHRRASRATSARSTPKELQQIEGIGKSTAEKIRELLETGKVAKLEALRAKHPRSVVALLRIQGLGPKAVKRLRDELGVQSIDDLRAALARAARCASSKGFGAEVRGEAGADRSRGSSAQGAASRTPISVALPLASASSRACARCPGVTPRLVLRLAAPLLRDGRRRRHRRGRERPPSR